MEFFEQEPAEATKAVDERRLSLVAADVSRRIFGRYFPPRSADSRRRLHLARRLSRHDYHAVETLCAISDGIGGAKDGAGCDGGAAKVDPLGRSQVRSVFNLICSSRLCAPREVGMPLVCAVVSNSGIIVRRKTVPAAPAPYMVVP